MRGGRTCERPEKPRPTVAEYITLEGPGARKLDAGTRTSTEGKDHMLHALILHLARIYGAA